MRRALTLLVFLLFIVSLLAGVSKNAVTHADDGGEEFVPGEVVVKLSNASDLPALAAQYSLSPTPLDQFGSRPIFRLRLTDHRSVPQRRHLFFTYSPVG